jgi:hypothetical protein
MIGAGAMRNQDYKSGKSGISNQTFPREWFLCKSLVSFATLATISKNTYKNAIFWGEQGD